VGLRAIEQRRYLVRASTSGPSAIVDPWGRVVVRTTARTRHLLRGGVRPERRLTPYARWGDAFGLACAGWTAAALFRDPRSRQGTSRPGEESEISLAPGGNPLQSG